MRCACLWILTLSILMSGVGRSGLSQTPQERVTLKDPTTIYPLNQPLGQLKWDKNGGCTVQSFYLSLSALAPQPEQGCECNPFCCATGPIFWNHYCDSGVGCVGVPWPSHGCVPTRCGCHLPCGREQCYRI